MKNKAEGGRREVEEKIFPSTFSLQPST